MGRKWVAVPPFGERLVPIERKVALAEAYLRTKWHLNSSSRLVTTDMAESGGCVPFREGGHHLTQCRLR